MASSDRMDRVRAEMGGVLQQEENPYGEVSFRVSPENARTALEKLRREHGYDMLLDLTAVDGLQMPGRPADPRFDVVYILRGHDQPGRIRLKTSVSESDPVLPTVSDIWHVANWCEREAFDQYGVRFTGHPNLKRILNHHEFVGHPLRKDYDIKNQQWLSEPDDLMDEMERKRSGESDPLSSETLFLNMGPSHPAMHGAIRVLVELDGETIKNAVPEIGYLHRGFEKGSEQGNYTQVIPFTDRLNYVSSVVNNVAYCKQVEHMLGVEITPRAETIRVILCELGRIMDHMVCIGACLVDLGALTNFWYMFNEREKIYDVIEALCGARLTHCYVRVGGFSHDLNDDFESGVRGLLKSIPETLRDVRNLVSRNRIFLDRVTDVGIISAEDAISHGFTGPCLRACGVPYDLRMDDPYYGYDRYDWDVVIGEKGDVHDRLYVRFDEMDQSLRIVEQALNSLPGGPCNVDDKRVVLPPKEEVYSNIEALMNHFMHIIEGFAPAAGDSYQAIEAPNGELGFYIVSDGSPKPYKVKVRPPCFMIFSAYDRLVEGDMVQDAVATLGSLNIIAGELDR